MYNWLRDKWFFAGAAAYAIAGLQGKLRALDASKVARIEGFAFGAFQNVGLPNAYYSDNVINSLEWWLWDQQNYAALCVFEMHFFRHRTEMQLYQTIDLSH